MFKLSSIQVKAIVLLFVFSLNTAVGFACSMGLEMGFNSHHHDEENNIIPGHSHSGNDKHAETAGHSHSHGIKTNSHHDNKEPGNGKDNCCNNDVIKFNQLDKACAQSINGINVFSFDALITTFYNIDVLTSFKAATSTRYFVRNYHPPIPDIRIAIQSFQI